MNRGTQFCSSEYTLWFFSIWIDSLNPFQVNTHFDSFLYDQTHSTFFKLIHTFILFQMIKGTQFFLSEYTFLFYFKWPEALSFISLYTNFYSFLNDQKHTPLFLFKWTGALSFVQVNIDFDLSFYDYTHSTFFKSIHTMILF